MSVSGREGNETNSAPSISSEDSAGFSEVSYDASGLSDNQLSDDQLGFSKESPYDASGLSDDQLSDDQPGFSKESPYDASGLSDGKLSDDRPSADQRPLTSDYDISGGFYNESWSSKNPPAPQYVESDATIGGRPPRLYAYPPR